MAPSESLDNILNQITTSNNPTVLNHTLRNGLPKESRDTILASTLSGGQDPLSVLDVRENTLGVLYILAARLNLQNSAPPPWQLVQQFCRSFIPEIARLAPDRVTALAKGIANFASAAGNYKAAVQPLFDLVRRYPPDASYLTTIHPIFALACVSAHTFTALLPVLETPITNIDLLISPDLSYNDSLMYHYLGGIALAALKRWGPAEEFFEIAVTSPGIVPASLQFEALKKLKLVQLIAIGKTKPLPKYTHALLPRLLKNTPYNTFINAYPNNADVLSDIVQREAQFFTAEKNLGLIRQALARAPRWALKKLTATYVTLGLADIAKAVNIATPDEVRALLLDMIESGDVAAQISADGTVTFSDPTPTFTRAEVDSVLADVQTQAALLSKLESNMAKSKEFLSKAVKNRDESSWGGPQGDEEIYALSAAGVWTEDGVFGA